ncbi:MAG: hypothetical protein LBI05_06400 [Planctomycetaceae bacterium]|jgi:hypothetical protein|nr:hypothetical protein [Planctomycetaceae bacterium]
MKKLLLVCVLVLFPVVAWADDMYARKIMDPAFDMYVNPDTLDLARNTAEASLILDVALQVAEGERILLRPHRAVSSEDLLRLAVRIAAVKDDKITQERLKSAAEKIGKGNLIAEFDAIAKLAGMSRNLEQPKFSSNDEETTLILNDIVDAVNDAVLLQNRAALGTITDSLPLLGLPEVVVKEVADFLIKAEKSLPEDAASKLAGESRQFGGITQRTTTIDHNTGSVTATSSYQPPEPNAGGGITKRSVFIDPNAGSGMGGAPFHSSQLQAKFVVVPSGGRAVTQLFFNSPLRKVGIEVGDIITHMDGIPVNSNWELDNHYSWTTVYGIDWRTGRTFTRKIYIP